MFEKFSFFPPKKESKRRDRFSKPVDDTPLRTVDDDEIEAATALLENYAFERIMSRLRKQALAEVADPAMETKAALKARARLILLGEITDGIKAIADQRKFKKPEPTAEDLRQMPIAGGWI